MKLEDSMSKMSSKKQKTKGKQKSRYSKVSHLKLSSQRSKTKIKNVYGTPPREIKYPL